MNEKWGYLCVAVSMLVAPVVGLGNGINVDIQGAASGGPGYNLNVGTYSNAAAGPLSGTVWNAFEFNNTLGTSLLDDQGNATDVSVWLQSNPGEWSYSNTNTLMGDYTFSGSEWTTNGGERFTLFSNIADGGGGLQLSGAQAFDVYIYTMGDAASQHATFQLNHAGGTSVLSATGDGPFRGTFEEGNNYVKFPGVVPQAYYNSESDNGYEFEFWWGHDGSGTAALNGFQVVPVGSDPPFYSLAVTPVGRSAANPVVLSATIKEWGSTYAYSTFYLDGVEIGTEDTFYESDGSIVDRAPAAIFESGTVHTGKVIVAGFNPDGYVTNEWVFTMGSPFRIAAFSPTGTGITNPVSLEMDVVDQVSSFSAATFFLDGQEVNPTTTKTGTGTNAVRYDVLDNFAAGSTHSVTGVVAGINPVGYSTNVWSFTMQEGFTLSVSPENYTPNTQPELSVVVTELGDQIDFVYLYLDGVEVIPDITLDEESWTLTCDSPTSFDAGTTHTGTVVVVGLDSTNTMEWTFSVSSGEAGAYIWTTNNPTIGNDDIYQFAESTNDVNNVGAGVDTYTYVAGNQPSQGQLFTTGASNNYELSSIWVQEKSYAESSCGYSAGAAMTVRITDPSQADNEDFVVHSESLTLSDKGAVSSITTAGTGRWIQYKLASPVVLNGNKQYGFDLTSPGAWFEWAGVNTNAYDGGSAYTTDSQGALNTGSTSLSGDRTFLLELKIPEVLPDVHWISTSPTGALLDHSPEVLVVMTDWGITVNPEDVSLLLDGANVTDYTFVTKNDATTTVSYASEKLSAGTHVAQVIAASGGETNEWSFSIVPAIDGVLYNINFAGKSGASVSVTNGTYIPSVGSAGSNLWNNVVAASNYDSSMTNTTPIVDAVDGSTSIGLRCLGSDNWFDVTATLLPLNQGFWLSGEDRTLELTGLDTGKAYDIYVYCNWRWSEYAVAYTITKGSGAVTSLTLIPERDTAAGSDYGTYVDGSDGTTPGNYVVFRNLSPDAFGIIDILSQSTEGGFSGLQVIEHAVTGPAESPVIVLSGAASDGSLIFSWTDGFSYNVLTNDDLVNGSWGVLTSGSSPVTNAISSESELFYKLSY